MALTHILKNIDLLWEPFRREGCKAGSAGSR